LSVPRMAAAASAPRCSHNPTRTPLAESLAHALVSATLCCAARGLTWAVTSVRAIWFAQRLSSPQVVLRVTGLPVAAALAWTSVLDHCEQQPQPHDFAHGARSPRDNIGTPIEST
jgi:hypothetical protein